jgi:hypothetical protein
MSNNPYNISTDNLSPEVAAAVATLAAAFAAKKSENASEAGAYSLAETVEKLRALNA